MLRYLQPPTQKGCKKSAKADWEALASINKEVIRTATYDALPLDYRRHIKSYYKLDFLDMEKVDFVKSMLSYEFMDNIQRAKQIQKEKRKRESTPKRSSNLKEGDFENQRRNKHPYT